ncbi:hypothetical protein L873DRAFT_1802238 [Choiromyces venosus 120613-1]|uniref:protein-histidine N-methyltransferase n=1 Tax=Choiromyces venosus 120613-1 TaxID=1336337 RepID=A0A3N4JZ17_9PEZI|nr:hypothetical protein L873DRAFT_1802238 [Choiromyces venosus 120613-1]
MTRIPRNISYATISITPTVLIPRRELYDVRMQLMDEDELNRDRSDRSMIVGLGREDIRTSLYEGGLKSWECSVDLVRHLASLYKQTGQESKKVLELGCGTSLPSLFLFQTTLRAAKTTKHPFTHFTLADYNLEVLRLVTLPNILLSWAMLNHLSSPSEPWELEGDLDVTEALTVAFLSDLCGRGIVLDFISGGWGTEMTELLKPASPYDLALGSETIYSPSTTPLFTDVLLEALKGGEGSGLVAAKQIYFGVGGSVTDFVNIVRSKDSNAQIQIVREEKEAGVGRSIVEISNKSDEPHSG